ncbi:MAG: hypothetical protein L0Y68_00280 [Candidatus Dadabacteria bacterium]|nr:hypothetical protein [Candidatus Dadabacteria bacterium]
MRALPYYFCVSQLFKEELEWIFFSSPLSQRGDRGDFLTFVASSLPIPR